MPTVQTYLLDAERRRDRQYALEDIRLGLRAYELWLFLGWREVKKGYRRSIIGPFWVTLNMGIMVAALGALYSQILKIDIHTYLPFLTSGFIIWGMIGGTLTAACDSFISAANSIRQTRMPFSLYVFQFVWKNLILFAHNFTIFIVVALIFGVWPNSNTLLFLPAMLILLLITTFSAMILGPLCARFRDIPMIVASAMQVIFFVTPVFWSPSAIPDRAVFLIFNPFYHLIQIAREPLLGKTGSVLNWSVSIFIMVALGALSLWFFSRCRTRIAYWV